MRTVPSCLQRLFWISKETHVYVKRDLYIERDIYNDSLSLSHMKCLHFSHAKTMRTVPSCLQRLFWTLNRPCQKPKETCIYVKRDLYIDIYICNDPLSLSHMKHIHFSHAKTMRSVLSCSQRLFSTSKETLMYVKSDLYIEREIYIITYFPSHI